MCLKNLLAVLLCFVSSFLFSQAQPDPSKTQQFLHYKELVNTSDSNLEFNSTKLLELAQTKEELTFANFIKGTYMYRQGEYVNAIFYLEKADQLGKGNAPIDMQRGYINTLVILYRRAGLIQQSNEAWEREQELIKKSKNPYKEAEYYYNLSKLKDIDEAYCEAATARKKFLSLIPLNIQKKDPDYIFATYAQLGFAQVKCGSINEGKKSLDYAKSLFSGNLKETNPTLLEIYELARALISIEEKNSEESKTYFDSAYNIAKNKNTYPIVKLILMERLEANFDPPKEQLSYSKEVDVITKKERLNSRDLIKYEFQKSKVKLKQQEGKTQLWISLSILSTLFLLSIVYFINKRNKKLKQAYLKIIEDLNKKSDKEKQTSTQKNTSSIESDVQNENGSKEIENESEIVKQLEQLEKKNFFTAKNMSAAKLAVLLKITPRNLSYLLKKHRNEDFYNYLNNIRIEYISKELKENPKLLNYKIAAISDMCGYSSHSQFATNFKTKTGISPSQYIQFLRKEEK